MVRVDVEAAIDCIGGPRYLVMKNTFNWIAVTTRCLNIELAVLFFFAVVTLDGCKLMFILFGSVDSYWTGFSSFLSLFFSVTL